MLGSYAVANRYNNYFALRHFTPIYESLPSSTVSILKPLLADNSWINRTCNMTINLRINATSTQQKFDARLLSSVKI